MNGMKTGGMTPDLSLEEEPNTAHDVLCSHGKFSEESQDIPPTRLLRSLTSGSTSSF